MSQYTPSTQEILNVISSPLTIVIILSTILLIIILACSLFTIKQETVGIIERFGKFVRIAKTGLNIQIPLIETIAGRISLRIQQLNIEVETKTKDNVFVKTTLSVQYIIDQNKIKEAFYKLTNPSLQIKSYVFNVVRAKVPTLLLDNVFEEKDSIAESVKTELNETIGSFGYNIIETLVTDIDPNEKVKQSMNEINASQRIRIAKEQQGEGEKAYTIKLAEAEAESKKLQGQGIADQRKAIVLGLKESVGDFQNKIEGTSAQDVLNLVLLTQYFDTLKEIGASANSNTILLPNSPNAVSSFADQIREATIVGNAVNKNTNNKDNKKDTKATIVDNAINKNTNKDNKKDTDNNTIQA